MSLPGQRTTYRYEKPTYRDLKRFGSPFKERGKKGKNPCGATGTIKIVSPEFTSLCPLTGQPDFATIVLEYEPDWFCLESKSLKMYLGRFRQHKEFHEACVNRICNDLVRVLHPKWIIVEGQFTPRGGIPFWPRATWERCIGLLPRQ